MLPILTTRGGLVLAKTWLADGSIKDFDGPRHFTLEQRPVANLLELHAALDELRERRDCCVIRGEPRATIDDPENLPGFYQRRKTNFADTPRSWVMFDVDGYECDWAADPAAAFAGWVRAVLPAEFHGAAFVWQLSGSAGRKPGLRGHIWFWLRQPMDSVSLRAWATVYEVKVDRSVLDSVQVHYTADPIMGEGVADPIWDRLGCVDGQPDVLVGYDPSRVLAVAEQRLSKLKDPREKTGLIGAFCRAFSPADVLNADWFEGRFEQVRGERWTWLDGGGSPEGVRVTATHLINVHNTAPQDTIARAQNGFDVLRLYQFGHLDDDEDSWGYNTPQSRPSYQAAKKFAESLPGVAEDVRPADAAGVAAAVTPEAAAATLERYKEAIKVAEYPHLTGALAAEIAGDETVSKVDRAVLVGAVQRRIKALQGSLPPVDVVRAMLAPARVVDGGVGPDWMAPWVCLAGDNTFVHRVNKSVLSPAGFDKTFNRLLPGAGEAMVSASRQATESWDILTVHSEKYAPAAPEVFEQEGVMYLNAYRHDLVPTGYWDAGVAAVLERHLKLLVPKDWERSHLKQWMAWVVRNPGRKVLHAILIKGTQGDGKSTLTKIMQRAMGGNVSIVDTNAMQNSSFTEWANGACLGVFEEIHVSKDRYDVLDRLKPLITNDFIAIHPKGKPMITVPNTMNYLAYTNHDDGVPVDDVDRRWYVLFSPWRHRRDFEAAVGEPIAYWQQLNDAIGNDAAVRGWLDAVDLGGFDPFGAAPETDHKKKMIHAAKSDMSKAIQALLDAGDVVGVSHDVVSTAHMEKALLEDGYHQHDIPKTTTLKHLMGDLGYVDGPRVNIASKRYRTWKRDGITDEAASSWLRMTVSALSGF